MHIYSILYSIYSIFSSKLTFKSWILTSEKKGPSCPNWGDGGGGGNLGNARKKTFFVIRSVPLPGIVQPLVFCLYISCRDSKRVLVSIWRPSDGLRPSKFKHRHRRNVMSYRFKSLFKLFSLLWLFSLLYLFSLFWRFSLFFYYFHFFNCFQFFYFFTSVTIITLIIIISLTFIISFTILALVGNLITRWHHML